MYIPFNKPYLSGKETEYIKEAVASGKISGDGMFTKKCHRIFPGALPFRANISHHVMYRRPGNGGDPL